MSKALCCYESEIGDPAAWKGFGEVEEHTSEYSVLIEFCAGERERKNLAEWEFDAVVAVSMDGGQTWEKFDCSYEEEFTHDYSDSWWTLEAERVL
jgi:hypothetical protein